MTSALKLITLINILLRTLTRAQLVFLKVTLITQLKIVTALLKLLRLFLSEKYTLYNLFIIKS